MLKFDFTKPGGFPWTQNRMKEWQDTITDCLNALASINQEDNTVPVILTGMIVSGGGNTVTDGWFYYLNEIYKFTGSTVTPAPGNVALVVINATTTSLEFGDASIQSVITNKTAQLTEGASLTDYTHFPVASLRPWVAHDSAVYSQLSIINTIITTLESAWVDEEAAYGTSISITGSGSFSGGTVAFNHYKLSLDRSLCWQLSLRNYIITGSVSSIIIIAPHDLYTGVLSGSIWFNNGYRGLALLTSSGSSILISYQLLTGLSGEPLCELKQLDGSPLPTGTVDIDVTILTEFLV